MRDALKAITAKAKGDATPEETAAAREANIGQLKTKRTPELASKISGELGEDANSLANSSWAIAPNYRF